MKCRNCNNEVQAIMNHCPICNYDLSNQTSESQNNLKTKKMLVLIIIIFVLITIIVAIKFINAFNNKKILVDNKQLNDMVTSICNGEFETIYTNSDFNNQGIYQCKDSNYVYYVNNSNETCGLYLCGELYEFGYTYNKDIEEIFPNSIYFYRESKVSDIPSELKIAVVANSEEELINNYAEKFYQFVKLLNKDYKENIRLMIYFNDSLTGITTTYDKLFLMAAYSNNNATQAYGMGTGYGEYIFYDGDPYNLLDTIFSDKNNYPTNARNALKNNRNIIITITDGETITLEDFIERLKNSFNNYF